MSLFGESYISGPAAKKSFEQGIISKLYNNVVWNFAVWWKSEFFLLNRILDFWDFYYYTKIYTVNVCGFYCVFLTVILSCSNIFASRPNINHSSQFLFTSSLFQQNFPTTITHTLNVCCSGVRSLESNKFLTFRTDFNRNCSPRWHSRVRPPGWGMLYGLTGFLLSTHTGALVHKIIN